MSTKIVWPCGLSTFSAVFFNTDEPVKHRLLYDLNIKHLQGANMCTVDSILRQPDH